MDGPRRQGPASGVGDHRRDREAGRLIYPVVSRRSGGLSLGVNLFPEAKTCSFDCPYCEVFAPQAAPGSPSSFTKARLESELEDFLEFDYPELWAPEPIRDLCLSGNGEPTESPRLAEALELCAAFRRARPESLSGASIVIITNSTGFLDPAIAGTLERAYRREGLVVWAKLDGGNEGLFSLMSGSKLDLERITGGILSFAQRVPVVIQTMLCEVAGTSPSDEDIADYSRLLARLIADGARISMVHLYTFARPTPGGRCAALSDARLSACAEAVRSATGLEVRAFGSASAIAGGRARAAGQAGPAIGRGAAKP